MSIPFPEFIAQLPFPEADTPDGFILTDAVVLARVQNMHGEEEFVWYMPEGHSRFQVAGLLHAMDESFSVLIEGDDE